MFMGVTRDGINKAETFIFTKLNLWLMMPSNSIYDNLTVKLSKQHCSHNVYSNKESIRLKNTF